MSGPAAHRYHYPMHASPATTGPARCFALVPCAGVGERAGQALPKQYAQLAGRPMVAHTLAALAAVARLQATLVVLAPADAHFQNLLPGLADDRLWLAHCGGATRAATVAAGLAELLRRGAGVDDWVLVHDAARCLLQPAWVDRLIDACLGDAVGGLLAMPLADTLKQASEGRVECTLERSGKWAAQTPQMFRIGRLQQALAMAGDAVTDEASALEAMGEQPLLVPGELENFKLTWPADLVLAERLLALRLMEGKR